MLPQGYTMPPLLPPSEPRASDQKEKLKLEMFHSIEKIKI